MAGVRLRGEHQERDGARREHLGGHRSILQQIEGGERTNRIWIQEKNQISQYDESSMTSRPFRVLNACHVMRFID
jgi:hypothetical protein